MKRQDVFDESAANAAEFNWQRFSVAYEYPVVFTRGLLDADNPILSNVLSLRETDKRHKCLVFVDGGVAGADPTIVTRLSAYAAAYSDHMELVVDPIVVAGGEAVKTEIAHLERLQDAIHHYAIDRHSYVIAIGGGAVLDAVGLAAATAHRGVRHIRLPTTVLGQNDSGVGVKNAVNLKGVKNYTGTFAPPWAVLNDFDFLESLSRNDRLSGISEAVKVALIRDAAFYEWLEANVDPLARFEPEAEEYMVRRSAELHMRQIAHGGDPFENGSARPLDFGHWAAHKLESLTQHAVSHGAAVAIGVALDTRYSVLAGLLPEGGDERVARLFERLGLDIWHPALMTKNEDGELAVLRGLRDFQEHLGGELTVTLLKELGVGHEVHEMDPDLVLASLQWLEGRGAD